MRSRGALHRSLYPCIRHRPLTHSLRVSTYLDIALDTPPQSMAATISYVPRAVKFLKPVRKSPQWGGWIGKKTSFSISLCLTRHWAGPIDPPHTDFDPFIFLVHHKHSFRPGERSGFPAHPHRGFETVTYILEGLQ